MDILHLVDRLEELITDSRQVWFTHNVIVDEERFLDIIDQMRVSIPEEIKKSQQVMAQRDRILAQAKEEADRTLALAREKSELLIGKDAISQAAEARAEQIIEQARNEANITRQEADEYVLETLKKLEAELDKVMNQVKNGIRTVESEKAAKTSLPK